MTTRRRRSADRVTIRGHTGTEWLAADERVAVDLREAE